MLTDWYRFMAASGVAPATVELRMFHMRAFARECGVNDPADVTLAVIEEWFADKDWSPNTRRSHRSSLRAFYAWAVRANFVEHSPAALMEPIRVPRALPRPAPESAYRAAMMIADCRTRLAVCLAAQCGLRRGEIARAAREDVEPALVGWALRVVGKGGHVRMVPLPDKLADDILARPPGWLFPNGRGSHLTPAHLGKLVTRVLPGDLTTHTLRHRAGTVAYQATRDLRAVQEFLGHSKPETTAIYTHVGDESVRAAMLAAAS